MILLDQLISWKKSHEEKSLESTIAEISLDIVYLYWCEKRKSPNQRASISKLGRMMCMRYLCMGEQPQLHEAILKKNVWWK